MAADRQRPSPEVIESYAWAIFRVLVAFFGLQIIAFNLLFMHADPVEFRIVVFFGGLAMLGPVISASMAQMLHAARGGSDGGK